MSIQSEIDRIAGNVRETISAIEQTGVAVPEGANSNNLPELTAELANGKQNKLTGAQGQVVGFDSQGNAQAQDPPGGGSGKRVCRFTIGTSTAGWTADDCDYLCDGTADDVKINAAIQALPSTGGEVVILDGTYNITATIAVNKDNVTLSGNGVATVLKRMWNGSDTGVITVTADYCTVKNLQIDGNKSSYSSGNGICFSDSDGNIVTGNTVTGNICNNNNNGIYLTKSSNNTITGNTCNDNNSYGISLGGGPSIITGNACNNNDTGIYLSSSNSIITGNTCNDNNHTGMYINVSSNNTITGNTCNDNRYGISLTFSSDNNTITGNACNNNDTGIYLSSSNSIITGNTCNDNNHTGMYINVSSNNTITGNTCNDNNSYGISLDYKSERNIVTGNTCIRKNGSSSDYTSSQYTIQTSSRSQNNLIVGNLIMGKNYVDEGTNNTFANNKYN